MIGGKKISTSYIILIACVLGVGIGLFGINYWHATKCTSDKSPQDYEDMISALNRRLLQAESQVDMVMNPLRLSDVV
jgi:predicted negative regulator of RcsB-dependent stress response